jgi:glycosyltransferase involved in cell wall biosynthesis
MALRIVIDVRHLKDFGYGTYIRNLIRALAAQDNVNQYQLIALKKDLHDLSGFPSNFELTIYDRSDEDFRNDVAFPLFLRKLGADLFHIPLNNVPLFMPKPYVVTVHDLSSLMFDHPQDARNSYHLYRFRRGLLRADRVIAVSGATKRDLQSLLNIPAARIRRIYNAIDTRFTAHAAAADARAAGPEGEALERRRILERYQINYPFLLYAGNIRPQKNIARLVEAFAVIRGELESHERYKNLRLLIIGDDLSKYPAVRRAVIQTRGEHSVRFLGFVPIDTLRIFYAAAEAFVFPSLYEGFGLPPLEAMASGTAVITSSVSSLPEVVGNAAMIVNPENVFDIARGMREVLLDETLRQSLVERGFERLKMFRWEQTAREVLETYHDAAYKAH